MEQRGLTACHFGCVCFERALHQADPTDMSETVTAIRSLCRCSPGTWGIADRLRFNSPEELEKVKEAVHKMVHRAIALDGTCTGEHGVGVGKVEYLTSELGEGTVHLMETIKRTSECQMQSG